MLERIDAIRNVGKFKEWTHPGADEFKFRRFTLVYARNGSGKSTIAAIIRAATQGDAAEIKVRRSLATEEPSFIALRHSAGTARFEAEKWAGKSPSAYVYDADFIEKNVYVGRTAGKDQRVGLLEVALGQTEVNAARAVDEYNERLKENSKRRKAAEDVLRAVARGYDLSVQEFVGLVEVSEVDKRIAKAEEVVSDAERAQELLRRSSLHNLPYTQVVDVRRSAELLLATTAKLSDEAERAVGEHITRSLQGRGTRWLREGLELCYADSCPYCGQDISSVELVRHYRLYFDDAYDRLRADIERAHREAEKLNAWWQHVTSTEELNHQLFTQWPELTGHAAPLLWGTANPDFQNFHAALLKAIAAKRDRPLEAVGAEAVADIVSRWDAIASRINDYNIAVGVVNKRILERRAELSGLAVEGTKEVLRNLNAAKRRHEPESVQQVDEYLACGAERADLERQKEEAKERLGRAQTERLKSFRNRINKILKAMNTGFSVERLDTEMTGGRPGAALGLQIGGASAGVEALPIVLSDGDRSALAFAVFVSSVLAAEDLNQRILVFDDPMTSMDSERLYSTVEIIHDLCKRAAQVIVLSHQSDFLYALRERAPHGALELELCRSKRKLKVWDSTAHLKNRWLRVRNFLRRFVEDETLDEEAEDARAKIRLLLEDYLRFRWDDLFAVSDTLEKYVRELMKPDVRSRTPFEPSNVEELDILCKFSQREHHGQALTGAPVPSPTDVRAYVDRALAWTEK